MVKQTYLCQQLTPVDTRPTTCRKNIFFLVILSGVFFPHTAITGHPVDTKKITSSMEVVTFLKEKHFGGNKPHIRVALESIHHSFCPLGVYLSIIIEQTDVFPCSNFHPCIARSRK